MGIIFLYGNGIFFLHNFHSPLATHITILNIFSLLLVNLSLLWLFIQQPIHGMMIMSVCYEKLKQQWRQCAFHDYNKSLSPSHSLSFAGSRTLFLFSFSFTSTTTTTYFSFLLRNLSSTSWSILSIPWKKNFLI